MKLYKGILLLFGVCLLGLCACGKVENTEQTPSPTTEPAATATTSPKETLASKETLAPTEAPTSTPTPEPTATATPTPSPTPTPKEEKIVDMKTVTQVTCPSDICIKQMGVQYGTVEHITYDSVTTGLTRGANVLLPADYSEDKQYAVLYFLHGIFGDEHSLIGDNNNKIKELVANLAAQGRTKEMIVVFPSMFAKTDPNQQPGFTAEAMIPYDNFINDLVNDLIPVIESKYSVYTDRENRAILGFSMGGRETLFIGLSRPDLFGYIGAIAPAPGLVPGKDHFMEHVGQMQEADVKFKEGDILPELLIICCGTRDSVVGKFPESYHNIMTTNGVEHLWYEVPGADHDNNAIKSGIYNFLIRWNAE